MSDIEVGHALAMKQATGVHLQKNCGRFNMIAMTFAILNTWIALAGIMGLVLPSGGSVAFLYGFIFCVLCNMCLTASLGELASIWPTAGGQYHYTFMLGTERWRELASFCVEWLSIAGWLTLVTTACYFATFFVTAAVNVATHSTYESEPWKVYLIFAAIMVFTTIKNLYGHRIFDLWNNTALAWSLLSFVIISITLLATSEKPSATSVFAGFENTTEWSSGAAAILGIVQSALSLIGSAAATHMSEEMPHPSRDTPRAMVYSVMMGGGPGIAFLLVVLFCMTEIDDVLASSTGMPITQLIYRSTGSPAAATILTLGLGICFINGTNAAVTTVSRFIYAMARDGGTPASKLTFGGFHAYTASTTIFLNVSYAIPILMLIVRGRAFLEHQVVAYTLGRIGLVWNIIAVAFVSFTSTFLCFPASLPVGLSNMKYVTGVLVIFGIFVAVTWGITKHQYHGPDVHVLTGIQTQVSAAGDAVMIESSKSHG